MSKEGVKKKARTTYFQPGSMCSDNIVELGSDNLIHIFSFLPPSSLIAVRLVCKEWHEIAMAPRFFRTLDFSANATNITNETIKSLIPYLSSGIISLSLKGCMNVTDDGLNLLTADVDLSSLKELDLSAAEESFQHELFPLDILGTGRYHDEFPSLKISAGAIAEFLAKCDHLEKVKLVTVTQEILTGLVASAATLTTLNVSYCRLKGDSIEAICDYCPNLTAIDLSGNYCGTAAVKALLKAAGPKLISLKLLSASSSVDNSVLEEIGKRCPNLRDLQILDDSENITEEGISALSSISSLTSLSLPLVSYDSYAGMTVSVSQSSLEEMAKANSGMKTILLANMNEESDYSTLGEETEEIVVSDLVSYWPALTVLHISAFMLKITAEDMQAIAKSCPLLQVLFWDSPITEDMFEPIATMQNLRILRFTCGFGSQLAGGEDQYAAIPSPDTLASFLGECSQRLEGIIAAPQVIRCAAGRNITLTLPLLAALTQHPSLYMFSHGTDDDYRGAASSLDEEVVVKATQEGWYPRDKCPWMMPGGAALMLRAFGSRHATPQPRPSFWFHLQKYGTTTQEASAIAMATGGEPLAPTGFPVDKLVRDLEREDKEKEV